MVTIVFSLSARHLLSDHETPIPTKSSRRAERFLSWLLRRLVSSCAVAAPVAAPVPPPVAAPAIDSKDSGDVESSDDGSDDSSDSSSSNEDAASESSGGSSSDDSNGDGKPLKYSGDDGISSPSTGVVVP